MRHIFKCVECGEFFEKVDASVLCDDCKSKSKEEPVKEVKTEPKADLKKAPAKEIKKAPAKTKKGK